MSARFEYADSILNLDSPYTDWFFRVNVPEKGMSFFISGTGMGSGMGAPGMPTGSADL